MAWFMAESILDVIGNEENEEVYGICIGKWF
jgi:hypothetical protein